MTDAKDRAKAITRRTKALTLVPLTVLSLTATAAILTTTGATATAPPVVAKPLPDGTIVPVKPIEYQASPVQEGQIAPAVPEQSVDAVVSSATIAGIPPIALNAYQRAAQVINASDPTCHMPWELIGAIGRVESNNGQFGGNQLTNKGVATPGIYGPVLNGTNGMALIRDTDAGALDHDTTFDRAVGPMQFLPSTWNILAVDANGDGVRDPQNIYDASLASAVYLCSGRVDMNNIADRKAAVFRYNHSDEYVDLVLRIAAAYKAGNFTSIPAGAYAAAPEPSTAALPIQQATPEPTQNPTATTTPTPTQTPSKTPSTTPTPTPTQTPTRPTLGDLLGLNKPSPTPSSAKMTAAQASSYCSSKWITGAQHTACTKKLTGLTKTQADQEWAAHKSNLNAWFNS